MVCPASGSDLVTFSDLPTDLREHLDANPDRGRQSVSHRRQKHPACPDCTLEIHGYEQAYAPPKRALP